MKKITAIGAGFHTHLSTNSDLLPSSFRWTDEETDTLVFIDRAISVGFEIPRKPKQKKIAWVCESRAIFYEWGITKESFHHPNIIKALEIAYDALFFSDKEYCKLSPKFHFAFAGSNLPWSKNKKIFPKSKLVSMIASNKKMTIGHNLRHEYAEKFKNKIDLFGGAAGSKRIGGNTPWPDKSEAINDYMFQITLENDSYSTYFTEKVTDCFATGTIPVYWGAPDIEDHFNKDGIIFLNEDFDINSLTPELYYSKMEAIRDNFERVNKLESADDYLAKLIQKV